MASTESGQLPLPTLEDVVSSTPKQETVPSETPAINNGSTPQTTTDGKPMSKNALKRIRKKQEWEDGVEDRRQKRREKRFRTRDRKRDERAALVAQGKDPYANYPPRHVPTNVPIAIILDCDFEKYMMPKELISLASQVTRSYSENRHAKYRASLWVSNFNGKLHERFRDVLADKQKNWKGISFQDGDFTTCAEKAREFMKERGGTVIDALQKSLDEKPAWARDATDPLPLPDPAPEPNEAYKDIVYLSSDSPYTLERLEPYTSYVIGGIVDKNREKGLCYKRARERGIRTAKLPIGQYMVMQSRTVLATNHVVEIMLKWLEYEDWGKAFLSVIPKRKGGHLRGEEGQGEDEQDEEEEEEEVDEVDEVDNLVDATMADDDEKESESNVAVSDVKVEAPTEKP